MKYGIEVNVQKKSHNNISKADIALSCNAVYNYVIHPARPVATAREMWYNGENSEDSQ